MLQDSEVLNTAGRRLAESHFTNEQQEATASEASVREPNAETVISSSNVVPIPHIEQSNFFRGESSNSVTAPTSSVRQTSSSFQQLLLPDRNTGGTPYTRLLERRASSQVLNTARRRIARSRLTNEERAAETTSNTAQRQQACARQTIEERAQMRSTNTAYRRRARAHQQLNVDRRGVQEQIDGTVEQTNFLQGGSRNNVNINRVRTRQPLQQCTAQPFRKSCNDLQWVNCSTCYTSFPNDKYYDVCDHCKKELRDGKSPLKFSAENFMDPGAVPVELSRLSNLEQILVARIHPVISVYRIKGQQYKYSGNVINFAQDVNTIASLLPIKPEDLSALLIVNIIGATTTREFRVRREYVREALVWLKQNHIYYKDIVIDNNSINNLPEDGIPNDIPSTNEERAEIIDEDVEGPPEFINESVRIDDFHTAGTMRRGPQPNQQACIHNVLRVPDADHTVARVRMSNQVIDEFSTSGYIAMAFPALFPYGNADFRQARPRSLTPSEYFQYLMKYRDGRFAKDSRFRYFSWNSISRWRALALGDVYVKNNPADAELSIQDIQKLLASGDKQLASRISYYSKTIRGSRSYWFTRMKEITAMVQQLGAPTFFFTLSTADLQWTELYRLLDSSIDITAFTDVQLRKRRSQLVNDNPCIVAWFFQTRVHLFYKKILKEEFNVIDHWYRYEWQHRGSPHIHGFLWLEDAPDVTNIGRSSTNTSRIIEYFDRLVCTENPDVNNSLPIHQHPCSRIIPIEANLDNDDLDYAYLINWVMRHSKCGTYCLRRDKTTKQMVCRFNFPYELRNISTIIEDPSNCNIFRFFGRRNDELVCSHNQKVLQTWRANIDWSPVLSIQSVVYYIAKYAAKAEPASKNFAETLRNIVDDIRRPCHSSRSAIKRLLIRSVSERDISAQEVCHLLMGYPLNKSSRKFVLLNISESSILTLSVRRRQTINSENDVHSDPNFVMRYMNRPPEYEDLALFQMAKKHYYSKNCWRTSKLEAVVRVIPELIRVHHNENDERWHSFCRQQVLLHHHYRSLSEAKGQVDTWGARYMDLNLGITDNVIINIENEDSEEEEGIDEIIREEWMLAASLGPIFDSTNGVELGMRDIDLSHNWEDSFLQYPNIDSARKFINNNLNVLTDDNTELSHNSSVQLSTLSREQRIAHDLILTSLQGEIQVHMIISGGAGTGKSTLINAIVSSIRILYNSSRSVRIMAPTGVAAFNVGGSTIHHALSISAEQKKSFNYESISGDHCRRMQEDFKDTKLLIIDEYSMLGRGMLANIDLRCRDIFALDEPFRGISVVLVGDMRQLPPVCDTPLYSSGGNHMHQCGSAAYSIFNKCVRLSHIFRQAGDEQAMLRDVLHRLSDGTSTLQDWHMFKTRDYSTLATEDKVTFHYALRLFPTKLSANNYNIERLVQLGSLIARLVSKNNCDTAARADPDQAKCLENVLCISKGARVMLRSNLATHYGLVNGSMGTVVDIVYAPSTKPPVDLPLVIMVDFDNYIGPQFNDGRKIVPIPPVTSNWKASNGTSCQRTQFPIVLCWAITIHKSQGLTLDKVVVDIGDKESLGLTFVALSRTRRLQDLSFQPMFTFERLQKIGKCSGLVRRRQEEERLRSIEVVS